MRIGSLFSGVGGLELGLERASVGGVVINRWYRGVLAMHWPHAMELAGL
jgi:site-specific DNA-cytosine methylase